MQTTVVSKAHLLSRPSMTSGSSDFYDKGDSIILDGYVNGFWRVYDTRIHESIYYFSDSLLSQLPIMDSIKRFVPVVFSSTEKEFFRQKQVKDQANKEFENRIAMAVKKNIPLVFHSADIDLNEIGIPKVGLQLKSISSEIVDAYTVSIYCYNNFNEQVNHYASNSNVFNGISQERINSNSFNRGEVWTLYGFDNTTKVKIFLIKVHFENGKTWISPDKKLMMIEAKIN